MICKWCGNKISPSDTKCKRCGKEVPALSDCGGFYDIVSKESIAAAASSARTNNVVERPVRPAAPAPVNNSDDNKTIKLALAGFVLVIVVILFVLIFVLFGKVSKLSDELDTLKQNIVEVNEKSGITGYKYEFDDEEEKEEEKETQKKPTTTKETQEPNSPPKQNSPSPPNDVPETDTKVFADDDLENIKKITFVLNGEQHQVPDENMVEITKWLKSFYMGSNEELDLRSSKEICEVKIDYNDNREVKNKTLNHRNK